MQTASVSETRQVPFVARPSEAVDVHTRILRLALGVEESRSYWEHVDPAVRPAARAMVAFEERWFGAKSLERVRYLLASFFSHG